MNTPSTLNIHSKLLSLAHSAGKRWRLFALTFLAIWAGISTRSDAAVISAWNFNGDLVDGVSGYNGTFSGTGTATYATISGHQTLVLDGIDNAVHVAANGNALDFNAQSFTIAAWLYVAGVPDARREAMIAGKPNSTSFTDYAMTVDYVNRINEGDGYLVVGGYTGPGGSTGIASTVSYGSYLNMVLTYDHPTNTLSLYRNSEFRESKSVGITGPITSSVDLVFGDAFGTFLAGNLDEIQIYGNSMTQSEVTALYNSGNGPVPVPEPSSLACIVLALSGCLLGRKRGDRKS